MINVSGFGFQVQILASNTFPAGITVTEFADDSDPFDIPSIKIANVTMGLNGDAIVASSANPVVVNLSVIPNGDNDANLGILLESNRVGRGKIGAQDIITMIGSYPDGRTLQLINGSITDGMPGNGVASAGRLKTKTYSFTFENKNDA